MTIRAVTKIKVYIFELLIQKQSITESGTSFYGLRILRLVHNSGDLCSVNSNQLREISNKSLKLKQRQNIIQ